MDGDRFDALTRSLTISRPRRAVLRAVASGAAGGLLALVGWDRAAAACQGSGGKCGGTAQCCQNPPSTCLNGKCCPKSQICGTGATATCCPTGTKCVGGRCCPKTGCAYDQVCFNNGCCTPTTCAAEGKDCGTIDDRCGGTLDCGTCTPPDTCAGGPDATPNVCGCTPEACLAGHCGEFSDGCGGTRVCGCGNGEVCDTARGACCVPQLCLDGQCGELPDGCGGTHDCGTCPGTSVCNQGVCVPGTGDVGGGDGLP